MIYKSWYTVSKVDFIRINMQLQPPEFNNSNHKVNKTHKINTQLRNLSLEWHKHLWTKHRISSKHTWNCETDDFPYQLRHPHSCNLNLCLSMTIPLQQEIQQREGLKLQMIQNKSHLVQTWNWMIQFRVYSTATSFTFIPRHGILPEASSIPTGIKRTQLCKSTSTNRRTTRT